MRAPGATSRATATPRRSSPAEEIAKTTIRARAAATLASTPGCAPSPNTAGSPSARARRTSSAFWSTTTTAMPAAWSIRVR